MQCQLLHFGKGVNAPARKFSTLSRKRKPPLPAAKAVSSRENLCESWPRTLNNGDVPASQQSAYRDEQAEGLFHQRPTARLSALQSGRTSAALPEAFCVFAFFRQ